MTRQIKYHHEFYIEDEEGAISIYNVFMLLCKLKVGIVSISHAKSWDGDITLTVEYKDQSHPVTLY
jgi:hypothetical protein